MRHVRLTSAVKMDEPFLVGDVGNEPFLDDLTAIFAVSHHLAVFLDEEARPGTGTTRAELEVQEAELALKEANADVAEEKIEEGRADEVKRPYGNAPKSAWVRYATAVDAGLSPERAEGMTKADLMSRYGERI